METENLKIELVKKILSIDDVSILESISQFIDEKKENSYDKFYFNEDDETQKGIETIIKMVNEFK
ncbi:conserved hypothetical protein [Flavobacterium sp. 9AF]|uniref:hypothetical protein n=1 Tax=Flavobacterium sp. 9AF TaxID=2653142 RepID=UPI0012F27EB9|nr:hypothetical protein [Flavobacterium sp. 9AF]VXA99248.1 conserved hypothetical protein [Flavobacterium sp. 9AF]